MKCKEHKNHLGKSVIIDSNIMLLLVVGTTNKSYIKTHKRLQKFTEDNYDLLMSELGKYSEIILIPNIVTEVSNLIKQTNQDDNSEDKKHEVNRKIYATFSRLIKDYKENYIKSIDAFESDHYIDLGITDSAILILAEKKKHEGPVCILTDDYKLAGKANKKGGWAENFFQLIDQSNGC